MRAVGYTRVSTAAQAAEDRVSLDEQKIDIQAYCASKGYDLVNWYSDVGSGASKRRPDFQRMLKDAREDEFDVIIAWKGDRLARGLYPYAALSEALEGTNITIEGVKDVLDAKILPIMAAIGKLELDNIRERSRMGLRGRARLGKAPSLIKFGYSKDPEGFPIVNEPEAVVVRRIFDEYKAGINNGNIVDGLNMDGITTRRGTRWSKTAISRMLLDTTYIGRNYFDKVSRVVRDDGSRERVTYVPKKRDTWIEIPYPPIIDQAAWSLVQVIREKNARLRAPKGLNIEFPLRGLIWCGSCGNRFYHSAGSLYFNKKLKNGTIARYKIKKRRRRYVCYGHRWKNLECPKPGVEAPTIEGAVWTELKMRLNTPESAQTLIEERTRALEEQGTFPELDTIREDLAEIKLKEQRLATAYMNGWIDDDTMRLQTGFLSERKEHYETELVRLEAEAELASTHLDIARAFADLADQLEDRLDSMNDDDRAKLMRLLVDRIDIYPDSLKVRLAVDLVGVGRVHTHH